MTGGRKRSSIYAADTITDRAAAAGGLEIARTGPGMPRLDCGRLRSRACVHGELEAGNLAVVFSGKQAPPGNRG